MGHRRALQRRFDWADDLGCGPFHFQVLVKSMMNVNTIVTLVSGIDDLESLVGDHTSAYVIEQTLKTISADPKKVTQFARAWGTILTARRYLGDASVVVGATKK